MIGNYKEALKQVNALRGEEIKYLVFDLLYKKRLKYEEISEFYVRYLETEKELAKSKESLFANCLGSSISGSMDNNKPFFHSQAYVLVEKWLPAGWIEDNLSERTDEYIKKNRGFLK